jgi:hypothetical protein
MPNKTENKRARIGPAPGAMKALLGTAGDCDSILEPLIATKGVVFPYTPDVTFGGSANYSSWHFTHSNYQQFQYQNSQPSEIQITGTFTAQTNEEARYMLAALTFLRAATMIDFGNAAVIRENAGTPPPVLRFNYLGQQMFKNVPVIVQNFSYILERDVDYVEVTLPGNSSPSARTSGAGGAAPSADGGGFFTKLAKAAFSSFGFGGGSGGGAGAGSSQTIDESLRTWVPTQLTLTVLLGIQHNPKNIRDSFDLEKFARGELLNKGFK